MARRSPWRSGLRAPFRAPTVRCEEALAERGRSSNSSRTLAPAPLVARPTARQVFTRGGDPVPRAGRRRGPQRRRRSRGPRGAPAPSRAATSRRWRRAGAHRPRVIPMRERLAARAGEPRVRPPSRDWSAAAAAGARPTDKSRREADWTPSRTRRPRRECLRRGCRASNRRFGTSAVGRRRCRACTGGRWCTVHRPGACAPGRSSWTGRGSNRAGGRRRPNTAGGADHS